MDLLIRLGFLLMCALPTPGERSSRDPKTLFSLSPRQACVPRTKSHRPICYNDTGDCTDADDSWKQLGEDFTHECLLAAKKRPKTHKSRPNDRNLEGRLTCQRVSRLLPCDLDIHPSHRLLTLMNNCVSLDRTTRILRCDFVSMLRDYPAGCYSSIAVQHNIRIDWTWDSTLRLLMLFNRLNKSAFFQHGILYERYFLCRDSRRYVAIDNSGR